MLKYAALLAAPAGLVLVRPPKPLAPVGSWQLDSYHSRAQLITDGITDYGKTKICITVGFARMNGTVKLDGADSAFDFRRYLASSMASPIGEDGKAKISWFENHANNTLVCFHSKGAKQTADGHLQTTGTLVLTRVDRNVELTPSEAYAGPVHGPAMIHRLTRDATVVFDFPGGGQEGEVLAVGSTKVVREDFPQLLRAVFATYWPPVVQDRNCQMPATAGEAYTGAQCSGTFLMPPPLPAVPSFVGEDNYPGPSNFDTMVGDRLTISVHMRLMAAGSGD